MENYIEFIRLISDKFIKLHEEEGEGWVEFPILKEGRPRSEIYDRDREEYLSIIKIKNDWINVIRKLKI
jgi:hypothetical protein